MKHQTQSLIKEACHRVANLKVSRIVLLVCIALLVVIFFTYHDLSKVEGSGNPSIYRSRTKLEIFEDFSVLRASDLKIRIEEMLRIKGSVSTELRDLEYRRQKLQAEILTCIHKIDQYKNEIGRQQTELDKLKMSVQQAQVAHHEALIQNTPDLALPLRLLPVRPPTSLTPPFEPPASYPCHSLSDCFDLSRCSFTSGFPVYLYNPDLYFSSWHVSNFMVSAIKEAIHFNPHFSGDENTACVYLVLIGERSQTNSSLQLNQLPFWAGDGRNHILINLSRQDLSSDFAGMENLNFSRAIVAQSSWLHSLFRPGHDLVIPPALGPPGGDVWFDCPYMLPARRKYLISFEAYSTVSSSYSFDYSVIAKYLTTKTSDKFFFAFGCEPGATQFKEEYNLCGNETTRSVILKDSTFALITPPVNSSFVSTPLFQARLYEAMKYGAIPVVLGNDHVQLPYSEVIYWRKAVIGLPVSRITELHFLLRSISDADILLMRRQTRLLWERYFSSVQAIIDSVLAVVRDRINLPPSPIREEPSPSVFSDNFVPLKIEPVVSDAKPEENLGPLEPPYASPKFKRNFTIMLTQGYELWNEWGDPFRLYPQIPFDPLLPSDAKFIGSGVGFRPVNQGAGGAGKEFCESLGGNSPREQFTIVILTYEREQVLMNSLSRLHGLPYLHQVVVVWNSPRPPLEDLRWPEIGVPVKVIKAPYNSLNNRFLPYEAIETEAVLSVDDDAHLRHDEIIFGFRVWREHRDRVVGFPGRFHALDINYKPGWLYNSNYSCELSMVLTGAAFVHKYYLYLYSNWLPQAIRDKVDEYMNCEDIAMNFLVSHVTRKPPIKVTSRWTFRCPGCPVSLSEDDTHFQERHKCINFFTKIFGYTPLLNTQFRADSILFKTRIPHDKQKCFKFI